MRRREFIINSALTLGGAALLSGCTKKEIKKSQKIHPLMLESFAKNN